MRCTLLNRRGAVTTDFRVAIALLSLRPPFIDSSWLREMSAVRAATRGGGSDPLDLLLCYSPTVQGTLPALRRIA
ncbi:MAG: hypothetical protein OXG81_07930 [Acidobacteria bacterium]|nr:hypothetical protein [Acidobacteriota bacterium]